MRYLSQNNDLASHNYEIVSQNNEIVFDIYDEQGLTVLLLGFHTKLIPTYTRQKQTKRRSVHISVTASMVRPSTSWILKVSSCKYL